MIEPPATTFEKASVAVVVRGASCVASVLVSALLTSTLAFEEGTHILYYLGKSNNTAM